VRRAVFYISDSTGITAETIGHTILTQFEGIEFDTQRMPFVDNEERARDAALRIKTAYAQTGQRPIVVNTITSPSLCNLVAESGALMMDVFAPFIAPLERELGAKRSGAVNRSHGMVDFHKYEARIEATNYALSHDDGVSLNYGDADVVLVGVSRSGKTPTCLYLALQYGVKAANYPLTDDDLERFELPNALSAARDRLFGLTIDAERLVQIRAERRPNSRYATLEQARWELSQADKLFRREGIACINTTHSSIEEIASKILHRHGIEKHMY
jgi:[pyruvate, water dikinase]-phosphate phosphotransferase / [pyruvate, water dikinase] kinase